MILDAQNLFAKDQPVAATAPAPNVVDLGRGDAGPSERVSLVVVATAPFSGDGGLCVELQSADEVAADGALAGPVTNAIYAVPAERLARAGTLVAARLPHGMKRYIGLKFNVNGTLADGTLTAGLAWDVEG